MSMWRERKKCCASCKHGSLYEITSLWWKLHVFTSPNCTTPHVISGNVFFFMPISATGNWTRQSLFCKFRNLEIFCSCKQLSLSWGSKACTHVRMSSALITSSPHYLCMHKLWQRLKLTARGLWIRTKNQTEREYRGKISNEWKYLCDVCTRPKSSQLGRDIDIPCRKSQT